MKVAPLRVIRLPYKLEPDSTRTITRFFHPGSEVRAKNIIERVLALSEEQVAELTTTPRAYLLSRHPDIEEVFAEHYEAVKDLVPAENSLSKLRRMLIGACFTMEYALESAALFNPSMVPALRQDGLPAGSTRFALSLRATGEGHISSIVFRRGVIDADCTIRLEPASPFRRPLKAVPDRVYDKDQFRQTLADMGAMNELAKHVFERLGAEFTMEQLDSAIKQAGQEMGHQPTLDQTAEHMLWLARSNYQLEIPPDADPSELVIFPTSENESRGIEDVRLVRFIDDDGKQCYYGTYTAYNGVHIMPQLLETSDLRTVHIHTMNGRFARNKGMALFPRKIGGRYIMSGRLDNENLYILDSDSPRFWDRGEQVQTPKFWWEAVQIGNCGSPLETEAGWLLLTHGVGPMRQYCIGASLLDRDDPTRLIGRTEDPLLAPTGEERFGYVPNVVYSCGAMIHNDNLIIPYAMSDMVTSFARVCLSELLDYVETSK